MAQFVSKKGPFIAAGIGGVAFTYWGYSTAYPAVYIHASLGLNIKKFR
jgi:hypothetical protein